jgi:phosphopantothenoylcysteine decarboxylase/phosphopantothenate--cysteine ligase
MKIIVTAGPTREYIDDVRFISNASSGRMGYAVAGAAAAAGHEVTLLTGPVTLPDPPGCWVVRLVSVEDLRAALAARFAECDALVMTAAVGDFRPQLRVAGKIPRSGGPVTVRLVPTEDVLAAVTAGKRPGQVVVAFAVEALPPAEAAAKAQAEMRNKGADFVVVNGPEAMEATRSRACVLGPAGAVLEWDTRSKDELAREIVRLVEEERRNREQGTRNPEKQNGSSQ